MARKPTTRAKPRAARRKKPKAPTFTPEQVAKAAATADADAPAPSITDLTPPGNTGSDGTPESPLSAAVMRICELVLYAVTRAEKLDASQPDDPDGVNHADNVLQVDEGGQLLVYLRQRAATRKGQRQLWREARNPLKLWDSFVDWMFDTSPEVHKAAATDSAAQVAEVHRVADVLTGGAEEQRNPTIPGETG